MCSIETHFLSYKPRNDDHILTQLPKIEKETHQSTT